MSLIRRWTWVVLALSACRADPVGDGMSLRCENDNTCAMGFRCLEGICVTNSPPDVELNTLITVPPGLTSTIEPTIRDLDGDPLSFQWRQLDGDELLADEQTTPTIDLVDPPVGRFRVDLEVSDGQATVLRELTVAVFNRPPTFTLPGVIQANLGARVT
ncbi:MAG: hypothetical protein AAF658_03685, partial [Myxococcota bacterium]